MTTPFSWNRARAFLATAQAGSFSGAAKALGSTQPTVGRQVAELEIELGVALFERIGNQLVLTPAGRDLREHVGAMAQAAERVALVATGRSQAIVGTVRITASELISAYLLAPAIGRLRREHPGIHLEVVVSNEARDLQRREADIAVRNFAPTEPELYARTLPSRAARFYATAEYLLANPPTDVSRIEVFGFDDVERMIRYLSTTGLALDRANFPVVTDNHLVQWQLCRAGLGICVVMEQVGDADASMRRVWPDQPPMPVPMFLVSHRDLLTSPIMRTVFDVLGQVLGAP